MWVSEPQSQHQEPSVFQRSLRGLQGRAWGESARQAGQQISLGSTRVSLRLTLKNNGISKKEALHCSKKHITELQLKNRKLKKKKGLPAYEHLQIKQNHSKVEYGKITKH